MSLLERVLGPDPGPFALLYRPETDTDRVDVLLGRVSFPDSLADIPLAKPAPAPAPPTGDAPAEAPAAQSGADTHEVLTVIPYRQVTERGFAAPDDGAPLIALTVTEQEPASLTAALALLPDVPAVLTGARFDQDDQEYAATVRRVVEESIGSGEGANFVIKRSFVADITDYGPAHALAFFRRLLRQESGAYWTFVVSTGARTFVGASPERHISVQGSGVAVMNPISGTYRYPPSGPDLTGVMDFLADRKEADELYMVVDEELKMMARICPAGGRVVGPRLKEMARLAHTEYFIEGRTDRDVRDILRETLFAPTVTGSPLESACRVIARHEPAGRGYYSGVAALVSRDQHGRRALDSAILIRTADIDTGGRLSIGVGATLVRHSEPASEAAETVAKAAGLIAALQSAPGARFGTHPAVLAALEDRNRDIARFWRSTSGERRAPEPALAGRRVLVVDAEDTFTAMIAGQVRALGTEVTVRRFDEDYAFDGYDLVVMGPGPGDPDTEHDPRIRHLRQTVDELLALRRPFVAVCLSHQVLSRRLGLSLRRRDVPHQGVQRKIDLFGRRELVGFYNTFAAVSPSDKADVAGVGLVEIARDPASGEVHALRGPCFASMQFHAESVLTQDGPRLIATRMREALSL